MLKRKYVLNIDKGDVIRSRSLQGLFVLEDRMSSYFPSFLFTNVRTDRIFQVARPFAQSQLPSAKRKILSNRNDRIFNDAITMVVRKIRLVSLRCRKKKCSLEIFWGVQSTYFLFRKSWRWKTKLGFRENRLSVFYVVNFMIFFIDSKIGINNLWLFPIKAAILR